MSKAIPSYALAPASVQDPMRFLFDGLEVRAVDRDGRPWFVGKDVCQVLGHVNTKDALSRLPDSERSTVKVPDALGRDRDTTIISIAGVFRLAMTSRVDGAERFRSWLTDEVLPQIYTRGSYGPQTVTLDPESRALIANLEARVTALEARPASPTLPTDKAKTYFDRLRADNEAKNPAVALRKLLASGVKGRPAHHLSKERYIAFDPAEVEAIVGRAGVIAWASSGWLVKDSKHHVGKKVRVDGVHKRMLCIREGVIDTLPALPAPRRERGPFERAALPAPSAMSAEPPSEWGGVPVTEILDDNLHLAGVGCWLYASIANPDATPKGKEPPASSVFRPGVTVSGTRAHPGPGAYAWTSFDWLHIHVSADIWRAHQAGDPRAT